MGMYCIQGFEGWMINRKFLVAASVKTAYHFHPREKLGVYEFFHDFDI